MTCRAYTYKLNALSDPKQDPKKRQKYMPEVEIKKGESVDRALKRLKNKLEAEGIMDEMRRLRAFETPIQRYRRKQRTAAKKTRMRFRANLQVFRRDNSKKFATQDPTAEPAVSTPAPAPQEATATAE